MRSAIEIPGIKAASLEKGNPLISCFSIAKRVINIKYYLPGAAGGGVGSALRGIMSCLSDVL